jgi:hypothetical protein
MASFPLRLRQDSRHQDGIRRVLDVVLELGLVPSDAGILIGVRIGKIRRGAGVAAVESVELRADLILGACADRVAGHAFTAATSCASAADADIDDATISALSVGLIIVCSSERGRGASVALVAQGTLGIQTSFLHLQSQLDQAADGFGARRHFRFPFFTSFSPRSFDRICKIVSIMARIASGRVSGLSCLAIHSNSSTSTLQSD